MEESHELGFLVRLSHHLADPVLLLRRVLVRLLHHFDVLQLLLVVSLGSVPLVHCPRHQVHLGGLVLFEVGAHLVHLLVIGVVRSRLLVLSLLLLLHEARVDTVGVRLHQLRVRTLLCNLPLLQHYDFISISNSRETVRHNHSCD